MSSRSALLAAGICATTLLVAACGSSGGATTSTPTDTSSMPSMSPMTSGSAVASTGTATVTGGKITIAVTNNLRFMPSTIKVPKVGPVQVTIKDTGGYPHNISVPSLNVTSKSVSGTIGETTSTVTFRFTHKGTYPFECTYHDQAGMRGNFIVG